MTNARSKVKVLNVKQTNKVYADNSSNVIKCKYNSIELGKCSHKNQVSGKFDKETK